MTGKNRLPDVLMQVVEGPVSFTDFEPRDVPGFKSDIADVFHCSENQTDNLLKAVDILEDDHHYRVDRVIVQESEPEPGNKCPSRHPREFKVTVSPA